MSTTGVLTGQLRRFIREDIQTALESDIKIVFQKRRVAVTPADLPYVVIKANKVKQKFGTGAAVRQVWQENTFTIIVVRGWPGTDDQRIQDVKEEDANAIIDVLQGAPLYHEIGMFPIAEEVDYDDSDDAMERTSELYLTFNVRTKVEHHEDGD